jgi:Zn-dependent peptidase ImmA (M78 family)
LSKRLVPARPRSKDDIESCSLNIIMSFQKGVLTNDEPFNIERFFDCYLEDFTGVDPQYLKLQDGIYGYTDTDNMECVLSSDLAEDRFQEKFFRSTMAHEVGHAVMHVKDYRIQKAIMRFVHEKDHLRSYRQEDIVTYKNPEWQAWYFAGAILMPKIAFLKAFEKGFNEHDLSKRFNVNKAFVRTRMKGLKLSV